MSSYEGRKGLKKVKTENKKPTEEEIVYFDHF